MGIERDRGIQRVPFTEAVFWLVMTDINEMMVVDLNEFIDDSMLQSASNSINTQRFIMGKPPIYLSLARNGTQIQAYPMEQ